MEPYQKKISKKWSKKATISSQTAQPKGFTKQSNKSQKDMSQLMGRRKYRREDLKDGLQLWYQRQTVRKYWLSDRRSRGNSDSLHRISVWPQRTDNRICRIKSGKWTDSRWDQSTPDQISLWQWWKAYKGYLSNDKERSSCVVLWIWPERMADKDQRRDPVRRWQYRKDGKKLYLWQLWKSQRDQELQE